DAAWCLRESMSPGPEKICHEEEVMGTFAIPAVRAHGTVRVSLPAKVAYSPDALKKSLTSILDRLGCPRCFSGANCHFVSEKNFVFDPGGAVSLNPQPLPPGGSHATVALAPSIRYDIDKVFKAIDSVIKGLGPCPCHSGI